MSNFERKVERMEEERQLRLNAAFNAEVAKGLCDCSDEEAERAFFALLGGYACFRVGKVFENA